MKTIKKILLVITFAMLLAGCSTTEEVLKEVENIAEKEFAESPKGVNAETSSFSYYIPGSMKVNNEINHNIILKEGKQTYILFVNTLEKQNSRVIYETTLSTEEGYLLNQTFEGEERFGFVQVLQIDKKLYEVTVGIGGVKITTETKQRDIIKSTESMMRIANSVRYKP
ncbi:hypothetical protein ACFSCX_22690 [Bacillus salitolerans]|uniref:DUF4367 domain-containing protein n=1 Tax=Bacillus salitolerans TaxID=1437434 RepID=A0ABW4LW23_9BACI